jgi:ABC-type sugar transport system substrate-binding protein
MTEKRKLLRALARGAALCVCLACLCRCTKGPEKKAACTICFAYQDLETGFWVAAHKVIVKTLGERNVAVIERNANQDANKQLEQIRDAIAQEVDGIIVIPQDGESALTIIGEANKAGVPIAVFNRPPANDSKPAIVTVADNEKIAEQAVAYMAEEARKLGRKVTPCIMVGDLGDPNAVARRQGFCNVIEKSPDVFNKTIEVPTKWDAATAHANLQVAMTKSPEIDFLFTSSDFMYPQVRAVLQPLGKWKKRGELGHVILGGLDGDQEACRLMQAGYVDATGVQDLFFEAESVMDELLAAIAKKDKAPRRWVQDPGFALTQANLKARELDMWGCALLSGK